MLRSPLPLTLKDHSIVNGAVGEVSPVAPDIAGEVVVDFPQYPSWSKDGLWECERAWLIPLSDPDIDIGEDESVKNTDKKPVEDLV